MSTLVLRSAQLRTGNEEDFIRRMQTHLRSLYPDYCKEIGEERLRGGIVWGIDRAEAHGVRIERDVKDYVQFEFERAANSWRRL